MVSSLILSAERFTICLFGSVPTFTSIATQSPADRGSMDTNLFGDISLAKSHFQHEINLVSLFVGKQFIGIHRCSFDIFEGFWQALSYLSLLITSKIFVALTSRIYEYINKPNFKNLIIKIGIFAFLRPQFSHRIYSVRVFI